MRWLVGAALAVYHSQAAGVGEMRAAFGGVIFAFVIFHGPNGEIVAVDPADGQVIVRAADPGYGTDKRGHTIIQTSAGNALVIESPEDVIHQLEKARKEVPK